MSRENSTPYLFAQRPVLPFRSARTHCPNCHAPLQVQKTRTRTVHTLHLGRFIAQETILECGQCQNPTLYGAEALTRLVPPGCTFGYDVVNWVGQALFRRHRRAQEVVEELAERNVHLSASEVGYLGRKFVVYLALAHRQCAPRLKKAMRQQGGYILHLDGTCEGGGPVLMSSLDSISEIVLGNVKLPSEKAQEIIPFLEHIKSAYGVPLAMVHDMGPGILAAVKEVFPGVPDFICHFHFLRDAGKDLLEADYDAIRKRLRQHGITEKLRAQARRLKRAMDQEPDLVESFSRSVQANVRPTQTIDRLPLFAAYSLIQWALEGKTQGDGYGFPFDRPHVQFAQRLRLVAEELERIKTVHLRGQWKDNIPLLRLSCQLKPVAQDRTLRRMIEAIEVNLEVFDQLRSAMRMAAVGASAGLNSGGDPVPLGPIAKAVTHFRQTITSRSDYPANSGWKAMIAQFDKYWDKLFADPIRVQTPHGPLLIQPQRTNNLMERFFRDFRRGARRKGGQNSISRQLQTMIADTPLIRNLDNPRYLKILLNGQVTLEERFAQIDIDAVRRELAAAATSPERIPPAIRQLIRVPAFLATLSALFRKAA